jgi:hypothetical protein
MAATIPTAMFCLVEEQAVPEPVREGPVGLQRFGFGGQRAVKQRRLVAARRRDAAHDFVVDFVEDPGHRGKNGGPQRAQVLHLERALNDSTPNIKVNRIAFRV